MLARKIAASRGASAGRNGRIPSFSCARAIMMASRWCHALPHPLPLWERVTEFAARSSRNLPSCAALRVFEHNSHRRKLVADAICLLEIPGPAGGVAGIDQRHDLVLVDVALAFGPPQ